MGNNQEKNNEYYIKDRREKPEGRARKAGKGDLHPH
jgi:hypothetical protein